MKKYTALFISLMIALAFALPAGAAQTQKALPGPTAMTVTPPTSAPTIVAAAKADKAKAAAPKAKKKKAKETKK